MSPPSPPLNLRLTTFLAIFYWPLILSLFSCFYTHLWISIFLSKNIYRSSHHGKNIIIKIQIPHCLQWKPLRVVESPFLFEYQIRKRCPRKIIHGMSALFATGRFRIVGDVFVFAECIFHRNCKTDFFLYFANDAVRRFFSLLQLTFRKGPVSDNIMYEREVHRLLFRFMRIHNSTYEL